ncbi:MAG TPA: phosphopantetheine-binding protein [Longimicrobiaceae bacterium]
MEETKQRLRSIYARALRLPPGAAPVAGDDLVRSLGIDSIDAMEILIWVEDEFHITIDDQYLSPQLVNSIDALAEFVERARVQEV